MASTDHPDAVSVSQADPAPARSRTTPALGLAVAVVLAFGLMLYATGGSDERPAAEPGGGDQGTPTLGAADAPVVVTEFSDFRCPYCQRHAQQVKPQIVAAYVDTGVVRYEWRDLPLQGDASVAAALAARAAQEQGRFWDYHAGLFERRDEGFTLDSLTRLAADLGLDTEQFTAALSDGRHEALVRADFEEGRDLGLTGTPSFLINGRLVVGAQPYEVFAEAIEAARAGTDGA